MSETVDPLIQECSTCGTLIDVSDEEPLALMHCPTCGAAMRVRRIFGNFEPVEVLGAGGMGAVYRAQDTALNRPVALKLLRKEYSEHPEFIRQFEHEAALTALVNHPNVVKVYSTGSVHAVFYIAMELVDKGSLDDLITLQGRVAEAQALEVGIQAAQGLRAAFQRGLMHRDVKPGNILFADAHHAKIVDFGLAAPLGSDAAGGGGEVWGTPYYVAPEKLESPPQEDFRSDIYSLGATLFHALAGRAPYEAEDASMVALKHLKSKPVSLQAFAPDISSSTAYVINRTLHKDPNQRYQSYDELIQHLEYARNQLLQPAAQPVAAAAGKGAKAGARPVAVKAGARPAGSGPRPKPRVVMESKGSQRALSFITLLMLGGLGFGGWYVYQNKDRFFPKKAVVKTTDDAARQAEADYKGRYEMARQKFATGSFAEAAEAFHKLEEERPSGAQPMLNWITLHAGLATALSGKLDDAHADFEKLSKREPQGGDPYEAGLSSFQARIAKEMLGDEAPAPEKVDSFNKDNYEAIGLLALGAKSWELAEFESALAFFRQFTTVSPEPPDQWIRDYRQMVGEMIESYSTYQPFAEKVNAVTEPDDAQAKLPELKEDLAKLNLKGALARKGRALIRKAEQLVEDYKAEQNKAMAEMESSDDTTLTETKEKADPVAKQFSFKDAVVVAKSAQVITDKGKKDKANLVKKYDWLASFKSTLTSDIGATPYTGGVQRKAGLPVPGAVQDADEKNLIVKVGEQTTTVPWLDVTYDGIVAMARTNLRADLPPDRLADRLWYLGVFADFFGKPEEAGKYFAEAVKRKPSYAEEWKLFPNVPKS